MTPLPPRLPGAVNRSNGGLVHYGCPSLLKMLYKIIIILPVSRCI